jgi:hypothetical protein
METDIFKHIKIIIYEVFVSQNDKATHFYHWNTIANCNGEPRDIPKIYMIRTYLFRDLIKRQVALSNYNEIEIDLFIVFPSTTQ